MPTTELVDVWRLTVLPLMVTGMLTLGGMLVGALILLAFVRRVEEAT